jgi:16S rRNA (uracil1498-N3)-methyltransferase
MRLHRFYTTETLTSELSYTNAEHLHQWRHVFRYQAGDNIILFGDGFEHTYRILSIDKKTSALQQTSVIPSKTQEREVSLALALIKKDNFELVLEKCAELGVTDFYPFISERSLHKMYSTERLEKILIEATEQSGWGKVPTLHEVTTFENLLQGTECVVFHTSGESRHIPSSVGIICIGPEGGFTSEEVLQAKEHNSVVANLPGAVLRAETAAIAICSLALLS